MRKPFKTIEVVRRNDGKNSIIGVAETYDEVKKMGMKDYKKTKLTHYIRTYAEVSEGEILCERDHCYKNHFNFCPHCGGKIVYREDILE